MSLSFVTEVGKIAKELPPNYQAALWQAACDDGGLEKSVQYHVEGLAETAAKKAESPGRGATLADLDREVREAGRRKGVQETTSHSRERGERELDKRIDDKGDQGSTEPKRISWVWFILLLVIVVWIFR